MTSGAQTSRDRFRPLHLNGMALAICDGHTMDIISVLLGNRCRYGGIQSAAQQHNRLRRDLSHKDGKAD